MHAERVAEDARRDAWLAGQGVRVIRFSADEVEQRPAAVLAAIVRAADLSTAAPATAAPSTA